VFAVVQVAHAKSRARGLIAIRLDQNAFLQSFRHSHDIDRFAGFVSRDPDYLFNWQIILTNSTDDI